MLTNLLGCFVFPLDKNIYWFSDALDLGFIEIYPVILNTWFNRTMYIYLTFTGST